jgi:hypothetical protein
LRPQRASCGRGRHAASPACRRCQEKTASSPLGALTRPARPPAGTEERGPARCLRSRGHRLRGLGRWGSLQEGSCRTGPGPARAGCRARCLLLLGVCLASRRTRGRMSVPTASLASLAGVDFCFSWHVSFVHGLAHGHCNTCWCGELMGCAQQ